MTPPTPEESRNTEPPPVHQHRPAVSRYRRPGDPRPRRRTLQVPDPSSMQEQLVTEDQLQQQAPPLQQLNRACSLRRLDRVSPPRQQASPPAGLDRASSPKHLDLSAPLPLPQDTVASTKEQQTSFVVVASSHFSQVMSPDTPLPDSPPPSAHSNDELQSESAGEEADSDANAGQAEPNTEQAATCNEPTREGLLEAGCAEEDEQAGGLPEISDLCSDTESAASLSLDGPLHSPPPLHSPSPPSSPDVSPYPLHDHFSEYAGSSPPPDDSQPLPDHEEDEDELVELEEEKEGDGSDWCSLDAESHSKSYPKTYADFYSESHPKESPLHAPSPQKFKPPPSSFPEPLRTSYPCKPPQESPQEPRPGAPASQPRQNVLRPAQRSRGRRRGPGAYSPPDRSVGCRLHHYDGTSDGERDTSTEQSLNTKCGSQQRGAGAQDDENHPSGQNSPVELRKDTISMAIKDIKEAIEEVKIRMVRSPYTPNSSVEPVWVMRQEVSPSEEACSAEHPPRCVSTFILAMRSITVYF